MSCKDHSLDSERNLNRVDSNADKLLSIDKDTLGGEEVVKKKRWYSLIDKVYNLPNLLESWYEVKENKGSWGIDKESLGQFEANLNQNLKELYRLLKERRYT